MDHILTLLLGIALGAVLTEIVVTTTSVPHEKLIAEGHGGYNSTTAEFQLKECNGK
jgi:hypothetical protein